MTKLNEYSLSELAVMIRKEDIRPSELVTACVERIEQRESGVGAFETLDLDQAIDQARHLDKQENRGALHGIPVGVKDIMNTAGMRTTMGSPIYEKYIPDSDATCVYNCRHAGAVIPGKTVTTEFACFKPGKTRNPHNIDHTPGGSSMGSAAAVADYMVPFALGSQTAGSVIRPAAYCGVVGYKSSRGAFYLDGVKGLSQNLDSLGFFVRSVRDLESINSAIMPINYRYPTDNEVIRVGLVRTPFWNQTCGHTRQLIEDVAVKLANNGHHVEEAEVESDSFELTDAQMVIMAFEMQFSLMREYREHADLLSPQLKKLIETGQRTKHQVYNKALELVWKHQMQTALKFNQFDVFLTPSAPSEAPKGMETGDPIFNRCWTALGLPCITNPVGFGAQGLPIGIQLVGGYNRDTRLIHFAQRIDQCL